MTVHNLKIWPVQFREVMEGHKKHEYRKDDRGFRVGDVLFLTLYLPANDLLVEDVFLERRVTAVTRGTDFGIPEGYCVMSIEPLG